MGIVLEKEPLIRKFEIIALNTPNKPAIIYGQNLDYTTIRAPDNAITYDTLNRWANQLAHYLLDTVKYSTSDTFTKSIIVLLEPGFEPLVALLAIWKLNFVYVPVDPDYPSTRIKKIIDETNPLIVIAKYHIIKKHGLDDNINHQFAIINLDEANDTINSFASVQPLADIQANDLASIYFTSGTTGKPKGVVASHRNINYHISAATKLYCVSSDDIIPVLAKFSFSISIFELLLPLTNGGTLYMLDRSTIYDIPTLCKHLQNVTFFHAGPSLLRKIVKHIQSIPNNHQLYNNIRHVSSGGDMVPASLLEDVKSVFSHAEIYVIYGASEISCMGCTYQVPREHQLKRTLVGRPFENMSVKILAEDRTELPAHEVGEICFSGEGLTLGYLQQPELTEEKFIYLGQQRYYRTGDVGRFNEDNQLEMLGRNDFQVKIRGMRVEISEVENLIRTFPGIDDVVVVARNTPVSASKTSNNDISANEKVLIAYIVVKDSISESSTGSITDPVIMKPINREFKNTLRNHLFAHLPDFMVPPIVVALNRLPLNVNLKVDRQALPDPLVADKSDEANVTWSASEEVILKLWQELLDRDSIRKEHNFFELGGDSLLAALFIANLHAALGVQITGMDVLRESLDTLAYICDQVNGLSSPGQHYPTIYVPTTQKSMFFFGPDHQLFGILDRPTKSYTEKAVLICGPVGQEHVRINFVISNLVKALCNYGYAVFRFDYYGCFNSFGDSSEATLTRWQNDISSAYNEIMNRLEPQSIIGFGIRLGGTLMINVLDQIRPSKTIIWDPVFTGNHYYDQLSRMQKELSKDKAHLKGLFTRCSMARNKCFKEILGLKLSLEILGEINTITLCDTSLTDQATKIVVSDESIVPESLCCYDDLLVIKENCYWDEIEHFENILPDKGLSNYLTSAIIK